MNENQNNDNKNLVHSKSVKAGKRIYYFDVKSTKNKDLYLTITESNKTMVNGKPSFEKHKLFLYKEDFEKFSDAFGECIHKISELKSNGTYPNTDSDISDYSSVDLEDMN